MRKTIFLSFFSYQIGLCDLEIIIYFKIKAIVSAIWGTGGEGIHKESLEGTTLSQLQKESSGQPAIL